jgi:hypothetical protein
VNQNQEQKITILLKIHNKASYDQAVHNMYDPGSATFQKFFKDADFLKYAKKREELQRQQTGHAGLQMKRAAMPTRPAKDPQCIDLFSFKASCNFPGRT